MFRVLHNHDLYDLFKNKHNDKVTSSVTIYVKSLKLTRVGDVNAVTTDMLLMRQAIAARAGSDPSSLAETSHQSAV